MDTGFRKRTYKGVSEFWDDLKFIFSHPTRLRMMRLIPPDFMQRLMLAVISVYGCKYCNFVHTRQALSAGVNHEQIKEILSGTVDNCPEEEAVALVYAQHWADSNARPDPEAEEKLLQTYGPDKFEAVNIILRMIRIGNLSGNSWDYLLYRLSRLYRKNPGSK